jgi:regulator of sirC expression with transglutaminase-like and TPR domain
MNLDRVLTELSADPFAAVDLAELNLRLAADEYPDLSVGAYQSKLDDLAEQLAPRLVGDLTAQTAELGHFLFVECGFSGNSADYYNAKNSYLNDVLDRRLGIPISLSLLAVAVGERCGLNVVGVGLPGHFIAKATNGDEDVLFDPFHGGQLLDERGCEELVSTVTGHPFHAHDDSLAATPPGLIAQRMLNNLKAVHLKAADYARAAKVIRRLMQLIPDDPTQRRDFGVSLLHSGQPGRALEHLQAYLRLVPGAEDRSAVWELVKEARQQVAQWN